MIWRLRNSVRLRYQTDLQLLDNLIDYKDINKAWENIKENIKASAKEILSVYGFKQHKPCFDEEFILILTNLMH
jgi:hypothetical protein